MLIKTDFLNIVMQLMKSIGIDKDIVSLKNLEYGIEDLAYFNTYNKITIIFFLIYKAYY